MFTISDLLRKVIERISFPLHWVADRIAEHFDKDRLEKGIGKSLGKTVLAAQTISLVQNRGNTLLFIWFWKGNFN